MAQDGLNFIHEINTQNDSWMIKVRIVRLWKQPFSLDMILMDERVIVLCLFFDIMSDDMVVNVIFAIVVYVQGEKIQGTIKAKLIHTFERLLAEGSVVVLSKFGVAENNGSYRIINHPCKLNFYRTTTVKKSEVFDGPVYGFDFVKFDDINNRNVGDEFAVGQLF